MSFRFSILQSLKELSDRKLQQFMSNIDDVHGVWLQEIKREADRVLTGDLSAPPELMPKTPSQKRGRKKRVSQGSLGGPSSSKRFSKGKRSIIRGSTVKPLDLITEDEGILQASTSGQVVEQPKRSTRRRKQTVADASLEEAAFSDCSAEQVPEVGPEVAEQVPEVGPEVADQELKTAVAEEKSEVIDMELETAVPDAETEVEADEPKACSSIPTPREIPAPTVSVRISFTDRRSAELVAQCVASPGRNSTRIVMAGTPSRAQRSSNVRLSSKLRYSKAVLRHSMMRRTSRRTILKKKSTRVGNTTCSSNARDDSCMETDGEVEKDRELPSVESDKGETAVEEVKATAETPEPKPVDPYKPVTRLRAELSPSVLLLPALPSEVRGVPASNGSGSTEKADVGSRSLGVKRKSPDIQEDSPNKKLSPTRKSILVTRPNKKAFLQSTQKKQRLMRTPTSGGRNTVIKSFIKHTTPLQINAKSKELLEALKKKQEQEEENMKKMEEEKRRKQEEQKRKRDERLRRVVDARMKEDEEKKKRIEEKLSWTEEKSKKMAGEKAKKKIAVKHQEEVEQKRRLEEKARLAKIQKDEKWQQELVAKRAEEEVERDRKLDEACKTLELRMQRVKEMEKELEQERKALAERERAEREKALQRELESAAREERRELEEKKKLEERRWREEQQRLAAENAARETEAAKQKMAACSFALNNVQSFEFKTPIRTAAALNITMEVELSPQSYRITPKGGNKTLIKSNNAEDYGMDQNSDDSTDDEMAPRKAVPSWAEGLNLHDAIAKQYFNPPDLHTYFGVCEPPKLEVIFSKSKPRYFQRTSSAVWHSPPRHGHY
ncbi:inner centromere protein A isoform X2 [Gadus morhua]|uniref:inner centromere protein A isoform X2 n=1 Tax=Gadus morhua TaxID=8049 RepID=UPI0011B7C251|nr:inner centromere protein A-like isoform X2 [Gadus morhua]